ncbi:uncharacterized protein LOC114337667 [Diabrotica virgifera virgifera]|uniref:Uncharacterized protein n=2 Tax=Diabrotica virgifera virgifera TaxID=50390 RepID=A0ABM5KCV4_DIAVI|nr:uncharacterized protein LOC114337667 [Diabrotica virgifera virgifera]
MIRIRQIVLKYLVTIILIVPKKRTAILVNRLMVALKEALDKEGRNEMLKTTSSIGQFSSKNSKTYSMNEDDLRSMERRGQGGIGSQKARSYWRCYFNAVTCF